MATEAMTKTSLRLDRASPRRLLARLLDDPSLVATVRSLPPRALGKIIDQIGLEDSGEIIALATTEQLRQLFDDDLWKSDRPGKDETFDADRFALWLEVMLEAGEDFVAEKLVELPEDLVTLAIHRHVLVLDLDREVEEHDADDPEEVARIDKAFASCLHEEIDRFQLISRNHEGWDAILSVLLALDKNDHAFLERVLERCCHISSEYIEDNGGLFEVLTSDEALESDVAAEREERRAGEGFVSPSQAASFLALCRTVHPDDVMRSPRDPVTRAYFRELAPARALEAGATERPQVHAARDALLLDAGHGEAEKGDAISPRGSLLETALAALHERDPAAHARAMEELAYLTNVLVAGGTLEGRSYRVFEAVVAVAEICNAGLEALAKTGKGSRSRGARVERACALLGEGADKVFRVGFWLSQQSPGDVTRSPRSRAAARSR
jgi:hypothetical protein